MFLHNKKMMYTVRVDAPDPQFAKMLLEQFGGPNGELAAALRYFTQGWVEKDPRPSGHAAQHRHRRIVPSRDGRPAARHAH